MNENPVVERKKEGRKEGRREEREKGQERNEGNRFIPAFTKYILKVLGQKYRKHKKMYGIMFFLLKWSGLLLSSQRREEVASGIPLSLWQFNFKVHAVSSRRT